MGELFIVGVGAGKEKYLTSEARYALTSSDLICGYTAYVDLIAPLFPGKETYTTPMKREIVATWP